MTGSPQRGISLKFELPRSQAPRLQKATLCRTGGSDAVISAPCPTAGDRRGDGRRFDQVLARFPDAAINPLRGGSDVAAGAGGWWSVCRSCKNVALPTHNEPTTAPTHGGPASRETCDRRRRFDPSLRAQGPNRPEVCCCSRHRNASDEMAEHGPPLDEQSWSGSTAPCYSSQAIAPIAFDELTTLARERRAAGGRQCPHPRCACRRRPMVVIAGRLLRECAAGGPFGNFRQY